MRFYAVRLRRFYGHALHSGRNGSFDRFRARLYAGWHKFDARSGRSYAGSANYADAYHRAGHQ